MIGQVQLQIASPSLHDELHGYLARLMRGFVKPPASPAEPAALETVPDRVFEVLTGRDFCYLSKARVAMYREGVLPRLAASVRKREPLAFYFDIGGGYHASIRPGSEALTFQVGLAELFVLSQAAEFAARVSHIYPVGIRFSLVIDNLCALLVNDIPLARTLGYCAALRELIRGVRLEGIVDVLVESEHFSPADLTRILIATRSAPTAISRKQHENVARFLGRPCDAQEASERMRRYREVIDASEQLLESIIPGVHMTQRASSGTICFRPFPGGDSRIQCGEVALTRNSNLKLCPILLTSGNVVDHDCNRYRFPGVIPPVISHVTYAERLVA